MSNFRERLMQFMRGRYGGNDTLNKFLFGVFLFFLLVAIFSNKSSAANSIFNLLAIAVLVYSYFRIFSKNIARRQAENAKFLELTAPIRGFFGKKSGDKTHRIFQSQGQGKDRDHLSELPQSLYQTELSDVRVHSGIQAGTAVSGI